VAFAQLLRYGLAGSAVLLCDALIFAWLVHVFHTNAYEANLISRTSCIPISFFLQRRTFSAPRGQKRLQFTKFVALWIFSTLLGALVLQPFLLRFGPTYASFGKLFVEACLAIMNFFLMRHWVYRKADS
jgi:putative flippase GtrA